MTTLYEAFEVIWSKSSKAIENGHIITNEAGIASQNPVLKLTAAPVRRTSLARVTLETHLEFSHLYDAVKHFSTVQYLNIGNVLDQLNRYAIDNNSIITAIPYTLPGKVFTVSIGTRNRNLSLEYRRNGLFQKKFPSVSISAVGAYSFISAALPDFFRSIDATDRSIYARKIQQQFEDEFNSSINAMVPTLVKQ